MNHSHLFACFNVWAQFCFTYYRYSHSTTCYKFLYHIFRPSARGSKSLYVLYLPGATSMERLLIFGQLLEIQDVYFLHFQSKIR